MTRHLHFCRSADPVFASSQIGDPAEKASIVEVMLREVSRDSIQTLKTVKQAERFLHLDSWSSLHSDEEQPPRVVGFFPSNSTPTYQAIYASNRLRLSDPSLSL